MFDMLLAKSAAKGAAERLYASAAGQARWETLYARMGAPDSVGGRFELLTLHVILLIDRLKDASAAADDVRQKLFDVYVSNLDAALREMGVGDLVVGKHMRKLGEAFYGRARAYDAAFQALPELAPLEDTLSRTLFEEGRPGSASELAAYAARCRAFLAKADDQSLIAGDARWPTQ
jgi:cytochrome b pre-mRNA-processing protein 3